MLEIEAKNGIVVKTPLGEIICKEATDFNNPGVYINFKPTDSKYERSVALVEYTKDMETVRALLWGNKGNIKDDADYTVAANIYDEEDAEGVDICNLMDSIEGLLSNTCFKLVNDNNETIHIENTKTGKQFRILVENV